MIFVAGVEPSAGLETPTNEGVTMRGRAVGGGGGGDEVG